MKFLYVFVIVPLIIFLVRDLFIKYSNYKKLSYEKENIIELANITTIISKNYLKLDDQEMNIKIRSVDKKPKGLSIKLEKITNSDYIKALNEFKEEINEVPGIIIFEFGKIEIKKNNIAETLIKEIENKLSSNKKMNIEANKNVIYSEKVIGDVDQAFNLLSIIFSNIRFKFRTNLSLENKNLNENINLNFENIVEDLSQFQFKFNSKNMSEVILLDELVFENIPLSAKKVILNLSIFFKTLQKSNIDLNFEPRILKEALILYIDNYILKDLKKYKDYLNKNNQYSGIKETIYSYIKENYTPVLNEFKKLIPLEELKTFNLNIIKFSYISLKNKNGFKIKIKCPGLTKFLQESIFNE